MNYTSSYTKSYISSYIKNYTSVIVIRIFILQYKAYKSSCNIQLYVIQLNQVIPELYQELRLISKVSQKSFLTFSSIVLGTDVSTTKFKNIIIDISVIRNEHVTPLSTYIRVYADAQQVIVYKKVKYRRGKPRILSQAS